MQPSGTRTRAELPALARVLPHQSWQDESVAERTLFVDGPSSNLKLYICISHADSWVSMRGRAVSPRRTRVRVLARAANRAGAALDSAGRRGGGRPAIGRPAARSGAGCTLRWLLGLRWWRWSGVHDRSLGGRRRIRHELGWRNITAVSEPPDRSPVSEASLVLGLLSWLSIPSW